MIDAIIILALFCFVALGVASLGAVVAFIALGVLLALGLALFVGGICLTATGARRACGFHVVEEGR